uniref:Uncharacterized protein n=1 Tax=Cannabis sativa TaxID=3483 RepID=A0A803P9F8_CANSA
MLTDLMSAIHKVDAVVDGKKRQKKASAKKANTSGASKTFGTQEDNPKVDPSVVQLIITNTSKTHLDIGGAKVLEQVYKADSYLRRHLTDECNVVKLGLTDYAKADKKYLQKFNDYKEDFISQMEEKFKAQRDELEFANFALAQELKEAKGANEALEN